MYQGLLGDPHNIPRGFWEVCAQPPRIPCPSPKISQALSHPGDPKTSRDSGSSPRDPYS